MEMGKQINLTERSMDDMIRYFNNAVAEMDIPQKYKMELLGMIVAIGYKYEKDVNGGKQ